MRAAVVVAVLSAALVLQQTVAGISMEGATLVNLVLVAVIYVGLAFGPVAGLLAGTVGGIIQDALAGAVIGVGGFSKTVVGFLVGVLGAQFIVSQPLPRFVMFVGGTVVHELCVQGLTAVVEARGFRITFGTVFTQAAVNAIVGVVAFQIVEGAPGLMQRRHARRASLSRRRY